jgi:hypothetical protein
MAGTAARISGEPFNSLKGACPLRLQCSPLQVSSWKVFPLAQNWLAPHTNNDSIYGVAVFQVLPGANPLFLKSPNPVTLSLSLMEFLPAESLEARRLVRDFPKAIFTHLHQVEPTHSPSKTRHFRHTIIEWTTLTRLSLSLSWRLTIQRLSIVHG